MFSLRAMIRDHRRLAMALLALAFCVRAVIPAGFMLSASNGTVVTVTICAESSAALKHMQLVIPNKEPASPHAEKMDQGNHCAFSGLGTMAIGSVDGFLLALAFAFILVIGLSPSAHRPFRPFPYLRPPLRGPPAIA